MAQNVIGAQIVFSLACLKPLAMVSSSLVGCGPTTARSNFDDCFKLLWRSNLKQSTHILLESLVTSFIEAIEEGYFFYISLISCTPGTRPRK